MAINPTNIRFTLPHAAIKKDVREVQAQLDTAPIPVDQIQVNLSQPQTITPERLKTMATETSSIVGAAGLPSAAGQLTFLALVAGQDKSQAAEDYESNENRVKMAEVAADRGDIPSAFHTIGAQSTPTTLTMQQGPSYARFVDGEQQSAPPAYDPTQPFLAFQPVELNYATTYLRGVANEAANEAWNQGDAALETAGTSWGAFWSEGLKRTEVIPNEAWARLSPQEKERQEWIGVASAVAETGPAPAQPAAQSYLQQQMLTTVRNTQVFASDLTALAFGYSNDEDLPLEGHLPAQLQRAAELPTAEAGIKHLTNLHDTHQGRANDGWHLMQWGLVHLEGQHGEELATIKASARERHPQPEPPTDPNDLQAGINFRQAQVIHRQTVAREEAKGYKAWAEGQMKSVEPGSKDQLLLRAVVTGAHRHVEHSQISGVLREQYKIGL